MHISKNLISGRNNLGKITEVNSYFQRINRGSLLYLNDTTKNIVLYNHVVIGKLIKRYYFLHLVNQRKLTMYIISNVLANDELLFFNVVTFDEGHCIGQIQRMFI